MYAPLDLSAADTGSSLLLAGSDAAAVREQFHAVLAADGGASVLVLATADAAGAIESIVGHDVPRDTLGVVDATGERAVTEGVAAAGCVDGPGELSQLGIESSEQLERLGHRYGRVHVGLDSVGALLGVQELPAVFRFLHVLVGRVRSENAVFVAGIDTSAHDDETVATVSELFDDVVAVSGDRTPSA